MTAPTCRFTGGTPRPPLPSIFVNNLFDNYHPQINAKGVVVWEAWDGAHYQIYRWDPKAGGPVNISNNLISNRYPQINAKGEVVWEAWDGVHSQLPLGPQDRHSRQYLQQPYQ